MEKREDQKIFIVDDHPVVRRGLRQLINEAEGLTICGEAESAAETLSKIENCSPDLVLVDLTLEGTGGLELTKQLHAQHPDLPVLILSMHSEALYADRVLQAGASGYVVKRRSNEEIVKAIRRVLGGEVYFSSKNGKEIPAAPKLPTDVLTDREFEVLLLIGQGYAPRHIAEKLSVSVKTVETHRQNIKQKLDIESAAHLTRYAVEYCKEHEAP